jgi:hypothetical protein
MKNFKFVSLFYCVLLFADVRAGVTDTASREVIKSYSKLNKERLLIDNRFGSVTIRTWKESLIRITIRITGKGEHKPAAINAMEKPGIKESRDEFLITCSTFFSGLNQKENNGDIDCRIDYLVQMPRDLALDIHNEFGDIIIGDYEGPIDITQQYGNLIAGRLKQAGKIRLNQGNAQINSILNGDLSSRGFDSILVEHVAGIVKVNAKAGDKLELGLVKGLVSFSVDAAHVGDLTIKTAREISADLGLQTVLSLMNNKSDIILEERFSDPSDTTPVDQNIIHKKKRVSTTEPRVPEIKKKRMPSLPQDPVEPQHPKVEPKKTAEIRVKPDSPGAKKSEKVSRKESVSRVPKKSISPVEKKSEGTAPVKQAGPASVKPEGTAPAKQAGPASAKPESPTPAKQASPASAKPANQVPDKSESPVPNKSQSPTPNKSKSPVPNKSQSPTPNKSKSPAPNKSESPTLNKSESSSPKKVDKLSPKYFEGSRGKANVPIVVHVAYSTINLYSN